VSAGRFVGQSVQRVEDPRLLTGHGRYVDDVTVPGMLHCAFVRSDVARGSIVRVDASAARALDGVVAVLTADDLNAHAGSMQPTILLTMAGAPLRPVAGGDVRFVGEPVALVVAESRYVAEDAAELVDVEIDPERAVVDVERALDDDAPLVHPELDSNVGAEMAFPIAPELQALLDGPDAAHVVRRSCEIKAAIVGRDERDAGLATFGSNLYTCREPEVKNASADSSFNDSARDFRGALRSVAELSHAGDPPHAGWKTESLSPSAQNARRQA